MANNIATKCQTIYQINAKQMSNKCQPNAKEMPNNMPSKCQTT